MKKAISMLVLFFFTIGSLPCYAYEAECINDKGKFSKCNVVIDKGILDIDYKLAAWDHLDQKIRGDQITYIAGGEYARRRVAESVATAVLLAPVFLFMLFSKKKRDNFGIEYVNPDGTKDNILIQLPKKYGFAFGQALQTLSGKTIVYEEEGDRPRDEKAEKKAKKEQKVAPQVEQGATDQGASGAVEEAPAPTVKKRGNKYGR